MRRIDEQTRIKNKSKIINSVKQKISKMNERKKRTKSTQINQEKKLYEIAHSSQ
jgi:hypothetical protein